MLKELFESRIIFVTGKGGVGKSIITSAMGIFLRAAGRRPLLVEFSPDKSIEHTFGIKTGPYREIEINRDLLYLNISAEDALAEYLRRQLILDILSKFVMSTKFYRHISNTAPGLKELVAVGKLYDLERKRGDNGELLYDPIIVDAPQLGKFVSFIKTPQTVMKMFRIGPVKKEAEKVYNLINSDKCSVAVVSTPDEMAITEALEAKEELSAIEHPDIRAFFVNMTVSGKIGAVDPHYYKKRIKELVTGQPVHESMVNALERLMHYTKMEHSAIDLLNGRVKDIPVVVLPLIETADSELIIAESLSTHFAPLHGVAS
jgi:anion-transporting  ArsA/GET3 family ATPase